MCSRHGTILLGLFWLVGATAPVEAVEPVEKELLRQAPRVVKELRAKGYTNVGVLKFLIGKHDQPLSDNVGPLNLTLARQMEIALVLASDPRQPLGIIKDASAVAARTPDANHLTATGREKLFAARYPLAWGKEQVAADAFLTGTVRTSKDLKTLTVTLQVFGKGDKELSPIVPAFTAANRPIQLSGIGESFLVRGVFEGGAVEEVEGQALASAVQIKQQKAPIPLADRTAPVQLEVLYNGKLVSVEHRDGRAWVPEPATGQKVALRLRRDAGKERYAVVLKVNGENTLRRERHPDLHCLKWIFEPGDKPFTVQGYQIDERTAQEFRVLSGSESKKNEINYGTDVGTISMTVYREQRGKEPPPDISDEGAYVNAVALARLPEAPANFHALKAQLEENAERGLIAEGQPIGSAVQRVAFKPDPTPFMSVTISYYRR